MTITSDGVLPAAGTRVSPFDLPQMASIALKPHASANKVNGDHIRFIGVAWLKQVRGLVVNFVMLSGSGRDIIFDRNYAHR